MKNKKIYIILLILLIIYSFSIVYKELQNDTFFYIRLGEVIAKNRSIDGFDHITFHKDLKFPYQAWLSYLLYYFAYNANGFFGVYLIVLILTSLISVYLFKILNNQGHSMFASFFVTIFSVYLSRHMLAARSHILSFLIFTLELYSLEKIFKMDKKQYFVVLLLLALLLVNVHSTVFPLFFVLMLPYLAEAFFYQMDKYKIIKIDKLYYSENKNIKLVLIAIFLCSLIGLLTPIFGSAYTTMFLTLKGVGQLFIREMQSVNILEEFPFLFLVTLTLSIMIFTKTKVSLKDFLFVLGFTILSLIAYRSLYFMYLFGVISVFNIFTDFVKTYIKEKNVLEIVHKIETSKTFICLTVFLVLLFCASKFSTRLLEKYVNETKYPVKATQWILDNINYQDSRIWTHYNFGSYLEFKGIKVFLDSRSELFSKEMNKNTTILEDWYNVTHGIKNYKDTFEKYNITHALLYNDEIIALYIDLDNDYSLIYKDDYFSIYEKNVLEENK